MLKVKLRVNFRPLELKLAAIRRSTAVVPEFRRFLGEQLDVEYLRRVQSAGDGTWRGWRGRTIHMRTNRLRYYRRAAIMTNRMGVWTGRALKSLFGRGEEGRQVDTVRGFRRISTLKQVVIFNFGAPRNNQVARPWLSRDTSPRWLQRAVNEYYARKLGELGARV